MTTAKPGQIRLWKAIENYRMAGGMEEHWVRRDHLAAEIEALLDERDDAIKQLRKEQLEVQRMHDHIHTCGPTCSRAGCVNQRPREAAQATLHALDAPGTDMTYSITLLRAALGEGK